MDKITKQVSLFDDMNTEKVEKKDSVIMELQKRFGKDALKTGSELNAEKRVHSDV